MLNSSSSGRFVDLLWNQPIFFALAARNRVNVFAMGRFFCPCNHIGRLGHFATGVNDPGLRDLKKV
jgi:hypothetical protein